MLQSTDQRPPNVILVIGHDLGDHLNCYDWPVPTPHLASLGSRGVVFESHFTAGVASSTARGALFSGCYPHSHGLLGPMHLAWNLDVAKCAPLPALLSDAGYTTHLFGLQHEHVDPGRLGYQYVHNVPGFGAEEVTTRFLRSLSSEGLGEEPYLAVLGFQEAHRAPTDGATFGQSASGSTSVDTAEVRVPPYLPDVPVSRRELAAFYGAVGSLDAAVGRLLRALAAQGHWANTLVVVTTDNGPSFMHGKGTLYDGGTRVALLMCWPGHLPAGRRVEALTSHVDLLPTILDLVGHTTPQHVQGHSVARLARGETDRGRAYVYAEKNCEHYCRPERMVRSGGLKYIRKAHRTCIYDRVLEELERAPSAFDRNPQLLGFYSAQRVSEELYDLCSDPAELHNVVGDAAYEDRCAKLRSALDAHLEATDDYFRSAQLDEGTDEDGMARLRTYRLSSHERADGLVDRSGPPHLRGRQWARRGKNEILPNIVLFTTHDTGDYLGCYGTPVPTPNIDSLAAHGVLFAQHFSTATICSPGRGSIMTGYYPHTNGLTRLAHRGHALRVGTTPHLARLLAGEGYETHLFGLQHEHWDPYALGYQHVHRGASHHVAEVMPLFTEWLRRASDLGMPFFAAIGCTETHRLRGGFRHPSYVPVDQDMVEVPAHLPDLPAVRQELAEFYGAVRMVDQMVGQMLEVLDQADLRERTLVILTTDHGASLLRSKNTLYDSGTKVAMLMRWPGVLPEGHRVVSLTSHVDILPSLYDLIGRQVPGHVQGRSFAAAARGAGSALRTHVFAETADHPARMARSEATKYVRHVWPWCVYDLRIGEVLRGPTGFWNQQQVLEYYDPHRASEELYDLRADPAELHNLIGDPAYADLLRQMREALDAHLRDTGDPFSELHAEIPVPSSAWKEIREARRRGDTNLAASIALGE